MAGVRYLDELAGAIQRELPPELIPEADSETLFRLYALLLLVKGVEVDPENVHDAWAAWMLGHSPAHPAIRPFNELDPELQAADRPYVEAIRRVATAAGSAPR